MASPSMANCLMRDDLARGLGDPMIAVGPVVAAARDQLHAVAVAL